MVDRKQFENQTFYTFATADPASLTKYSLQELVNYSGDDNPLALGIVGSLRGILSRILPGWDSKPAEYDGAINETLPYYALHKQPWVSEAARYLAQEGYILTHYQGCLLLQKEFDEPDFVQTLMSPRIGIHDRDQIALIVPRTHENESDWDSIVLQLETISIR